MTSFLIVIVAFNLITTNVDNYKFDDFFANF